MKRTLGFLLIINNEIFSRFRRFNEIRLFFHVASMSKFKFILSAILSMYRDFNAISSNWHRVLSKFELFWHSHSTWPLCWHDIDTFYTGCCRWAIIKYHPTEVWIRFWIKISEIEILPMWHAHRVHALVSTEGTL